MEDNAPLTSTDPPLKDSIMEIFNLAAATRDPRFQMIHSAFRNTMCVEHISRILSGIEPDRQMLFLWAFPQV